MIKEFTGVKREKGLNEIKRKNWGKASALLATFGLALTIFAGCGAENSGDQGKTGDGAAGLSGKITIIGSTSVGPLARSLADSFMEQEKGVSIDIQEIGSTEGIQAVINGTADIGTASRELKDAEKEAGLDVQTIAYDGIAIVVNPANPVADLTSEQIAQIFKGAITNWQELGGVNQEITVVNREAGSGTRGAFQELLELEEKQADGTKRSLLTDQSLVMDSTGAVKATVAANKAAIGYISLGVLDETVKGVKVNGIEPTLQNVKNKTYAIWRPFLMLTPSGELKAEVKAYLDYIKSVEGQRIVETEKFIPVN